MLWKFLDSNLEPFKDGFPDLSGTAVAMSPVADYRHQLLDAEHDEMEKMAAVRQLGFSSGRYCAHLAQDLLGLDVKAIGRLDRVPVWPRHSMGSITHSSHIAAAIATTHFASVGIDIEETGRVDEKLYRTLFTETEQSRLPEYDFDAATVVFSAKESGYKAVYPLAQKFISFQEADIYLDPESHSFSINYIGEHSPNRVLNGGAGYWLEHEGHVLTMFMLP